jgi:hypothetical protein
MAVDDGARWVLAHPTVEVWCGGEKAAGDPLTAAEKAAVGHLQAVHVGGC